MTEKEAARARLRRSEKNLIDLSHRIHAHPELGFEEEKACAWLCDELDGAGFKVTRGAGGMETAFVAQAGSGPLHVAICAEYDALPGIGHACGHNLIAAMSLGAGLAAASVADDVGLTVSVIGTPAEEVGNDSGKIRLLEAGAFQGVHVAMMAHPAPIEVVEMGIIAASMFEVHYTGKEAHASAFPEQGINAADAMVIAQTAIGLLRQQLRPTDRVHGIVTHGGDAPNVIPAHTSARYIVRGQTLTDLEQVREKVQRCFHAGALATGASLEIRGGNKPYADMHFDHELGACYRRNAEAAGRKFTPLPPGADRMAASTDMGNVSHLIPSIHPMIGLDSLPAANHQPEFTAHCATPIADRAVVEGALALAWTALDCAAEPALRQRLLAAR
ncbi:MAG: M20 family metallopeptidase [Terriglobales bacterium]